MRPLLRSLFSRRGHHIPKPNPRSSTGNSRARPLLIKSMSGLTSAAAYACVISTPRSLGAVPEDVKNKAHHAKDGKGFINPWDSFVDASAPKIIKDILWHRISGKGNNPDTTPPTVPIREPSFLPARTGYSDKLRATWLGHACYYVEFPSGLRVLFDPVFEDRCSPFTWMGPKRYNPAPCKLEDLPIVDVVIISHSHYDHLSHPTVKAIQQRHPNVYFAVPKGLKKWFAESGITNAVELDWWEDVDVTLSKSTGEKKAINATDPASPLPAEGNDDITARISSLPCQHTSARTPFDKAHTLWSSWAVSSGGKSVWFGGDTGYRSVPEVPKGVDDWGPEYAHLPRCPAFKQIGELRGPFDLGLIPIGAYDPRYIMSPVHANPFDSVEIFTDTKCRRAMGIHWGTWVLTEEDVMEPPQLLKKALERKGLPETGVFDVCDLGESREF